MGIPVVRVTTSEEAKTAELQEKIAKVCGATLVLADIPVALHVDRAIRNMVSTRDDLSNEQTELIANCLSVKVDETKKNHQVSEYTGGQAKRQICLICRKERKCECETIAQRDTQGEGLVNQQIQGVCCMKAQVREIS